MATVKAQGQLGMDETTIDDDALASALGTRESRKQTAANARKGFKEAHDKVVGMVEALDLPDDSFPLRIGAYRIAKRFVPSRSVSFETDPTSRIQITLLDE